MPGRRSHSDLVGARYVVVMSMLTLSVFTFGFVLAMVFLSRLEEDVSQAREFSSFRGQLAAGVAPTGPLNNKGQLWPLGTPMARIQIPVLHVSDVVLEGTTSGVLTAGPGHERSTVLPGQAGTSVIFGRAAAFGGPFGELHHLRPGDTITTTTGIGTATFKVIDVRRAGDPDPPPLASGSGRLILVTATGAPFMPSGVLRVDADIVGNAQPDSSLGLPAVGKRELPLGTDSGQLWGLVFLLEGLVILAVAGVWMWRSWGAARTWIVLSPLSMLLLYALLGQAARLLPNLT
jgi:sortase A